MSVANVASKPRRPKRLRPTGFATKTREEELLASRIQIGQELGLDSHYVTSIFQDVVDDSVRIQQEYFQEKANEGPGVIRVAFQGIEGSYSHLAGQEYFSRKGASIFYVGQSQFKDVVEAVEKGQADLAILPIENTTSGGINDVYDLLLHAQLSIVGEIKFKVRALPARPAGR